MTDEPPRPLRADAARNVERILRAARQTFDELGADASLEDIATRAGVGVATLYRRFPNRSELIRAALEQSMADDFAPSIEHALAQEDARTGMAILIEAAIDSAARERNTLAAARNSNSIAMNVDSAFFNACTVLLERGQADGVIRRDLIPEDLPRLMVMVMSTLWTVAPGSAGPRRYVRLLLDGMFIGEQVPLPSEADLLPPQRWPAYNSQASLDAITPKDTP